MTVPWWQGRMVGFDMETTDKDPETARIVQASIVAVGAGLTPDTLTLLVDPGVPVEDGAAEVHGLTTEYLQENGVDHCEAINVILNTLAVYCLYAPLVAFNARFDLTILDREARRYGLVPLQDRIRLRVIDPLIIDKELHRYRKGKRTLAAFCEQYGITSFATANQHDANDDALAACRAAWIMGNRGVVIRRTRNPREQAEYDDVSATWERCRNDLDRLHDQQVIWAERQAVGLADYFVGLSQDMERQGKLEDATALWEKAQGVVAQWPVHLPSAVAA